MTNSKEIKTNKGYNLNINYSLILGSDWNKFLKKLLESEYMNNLMTFIHESYKQFKIHPFKTDLFKSFRLIKPDDIRVVILADKPYANKEAIGIPFGNEDSYGKTFSRELIKILDQIARIQHGGFKLYLNPELDHWFEQGILLLDSTLTTEENSKESHSKYWRNFTRNIIQELNEQKSGIIFVFWGDEAQYFKQYVDDRKNYILEYEHPSTAVAENRDWHCSNFKEINNILEKLNGPDTIINW